MSITDSLIKITKKAFHAVKLDVKRYNLSSSEGLLLTTIQKNFDIGTVIDVGGNEGQYAMGIIEHGYNGKIYTFEPIPKMFEILNRNAKGYPQWTALNCAIGSSEGELMMNISENFASSSILKVNDNSLAAEPRTRITRQEKINIQTLDHFFDKTYEIQKGLMIKLDIQGYELEALKGATNTLAKASVVQSEVSFVPLYDGAPLFQEIVNYMKQKGFWIFTIIPGFRNPETGQLLQADCIFVRKSSN